MLSVSTVVGEKASDVEQSCGAGAKLAGRRPPPQWTGRGPVNERIKFGQLSVLLLECARVYVNGCVSECLYNAIVVRRLWTVEKDV